MMRAVMEELQSARMEYAIGGHNVRGFDLPHIHEAVVRNGLTEFKDLSKVLMTEETSIIDTMKVMKTVAQRGLWGHLGEKAPSFGFKNEHMLALAGVTEEQMQRELGVVNYVWHDPIFDIMATKRARRGILSAAETGFQPESLDVAAYVDSVRRSANQKQMTFVNELLNDIHESALRDIPYIYVPGGQAQATSKVRVAMDDYLKKFDPANWESLYARFEEKVEGVAHKIIKRLEESESPTLSTAGSQFRSFVEERNGVKYIMSTAIGVEATPMILPYMIASTGVKTLIYDDGESVQEVKSQLEGYERVMRKKHDRATDINGMAFHVYRNRKKHHRMTPQEHTCAFCGGAGCRFCGG